MQSSYPLNQQCIDALNEQISRELEAFCAYKALANFFTHPDRALFNVGKYFEAMAAEEVEHAKRFEDYLLLRGVQPFFRDLKSFNPPHDLTLLGSFELALKFEQGVFSSIRRIHDAADQAGDGHLTTFLEDIFFEDQLKAEQEIAGYLTIIKRLGAGVGEFLFDKEGLHVK